MSSNTKVDIPITFTPLTEKQIDDKIEQEHVKSLFSNDDMEKENKPAELDVGMQEYENMIEEAFSKPIIEPLSNIPYILRLSVKDLDFNELAIEVLKNEKATVIVLYKSKVFRLKKRSDEKWNNLKANDLIVLKKKYRNNSRFGGQIGLDFEYVDEAKTLK